VIRALAAAGAALALSATAAEWIDLGEPAPDPVHGWARGRSWTPSMVPTPEGLCLVGAGRHGAVNSRGRYQDDITCYDPGAHAWVTLWPGTHAATLSLELDPETGFEIDPTTRDPFPVAQWAHGYNLTSYHAATGELVIIGSADPYWENAIPQRYDWLPEGSTQYSPSIPHAPWRFHVATRTWTRDNPDAPVPAWRNFEGVLESVGGRLALIRFGEVWWYDTTARTWTKSTAPAHAANTAYDHVACQLDGKIYVAKGWATSAFDLAAETWETLPGSPYASTGGGAAMTCDTEHGVVLLIVYEDGARSVRAYDVAAGSWSGELAQPEWTYRPVVNCGYQSGVHYCHAAQDSEPSDDTAPRGRIFAYRYSPAAPSRNRLRNVSAQ
jgi:hypothetical protein